MTILPRNKTLAVARRRSPLAIRRLLLLLAVCAQFLPVWFDCFQGSQGQDLSLHPSAIPGLVLFIPTDRGRTDLEPRDTGIALALREPSVDLRLDCFGQAAPSPQQGSYHNRILAGNCSRRGPPAC